MRTFSVSARRATGLLIMGLCVVLALGSCERSVGSSPQLFAYADKDFSATLNGEMTRLSPDGYGGNPALVGEGSTGVARSFRAQVSVATSPSGERTLTVAYTAPASLAGMTVQKRTDPVGGASAVTLTRASEAGGVSVDLSGVAPTITDTLLSPVEILLPAGDVMTVSPETDGFQTVTLVGTGTEATFTFAEGQPLPIRVTWTNAARCVEVTLAPRG